jgi:hypothetical protein
MIVVRPYILLELGWETPNQFLRRMNQISPHYERLHLNPLRPSNQIAFSSKHVERCALTEWVNKAFGIHKSPSILGLDDG